MSEPDPVAGWGPWVVPAAQRAYNAYGDHAGWRNHLNAPMPLWYALPVATQHHWYAAVAGAVQGYLVREWPGRPADGAGASAARSVPGVRITVNFEDGTDDNLSPTAYRIENDCLVATWEPQDVVDGRRRIEYYPLRRIASIIVSPDE